MASRTLDNLSFADFLLQLQAINPKKLRVNGDSCQMCCPFHKENVPSFSVFQTNGTKAHWICFAGCGKGDLVDFMQKYYQIDFKEACKRLGITVNNENTANVSSKKSNVRLLTDIRNYFGKAFNNPEDQLYKMNISEKDIYYYEAPLGIKVAPELNSEPVELKSYYVCVFRGIRGKQCRFFHYDSNDNFVPSAKENNIPFIKFPYNISEVLKSKKKLLIVEGEKDVETIREYFPDFIGISFKHISVPQPNCTINRYKQFFDLIFANRLDRIVFICPDNDKAGKIYMDNICESIRSYVDKFIRIRLPYISSMKLGADITDWVKFSLERKKSTKEEIQAALNRCTSEINGWDYKRSRIWWRFNPCLDESDKKEKAKSNVPVNCWENLYSFFEFNRCIIRLDIVTRRIVGDFGNLRGFIDSNDSELGFNLDKLKNLLEQPQEDLERGQVFLGMKIKSEEELNKRLNSYVEECQFNDMLDEISVSPIYDVSSYKEKDFGDFYIESKQKGTFDHYKFGRYIFPPLFEKLVENITFICQDDHSLNFQRLLIFKTLLACPYMLENDKGERCVRGDLRLVGSNAIGKSTFCEELFGSFLGKKWYNSVPRIDVRDRDSRKVALFTPCLIIDEGTIYGTKAEIRAFYSEKVFKFMDKWKTSASQIPRRNIIISSSNNLCNSKDIESERRMWQVEIATYLPRISKMSYDRYLKSKEDIEFWERYDIRREEGKDSFEFPIMEFWREMYALYKHYESRNQIESILDLAGDKLRFYKDIWMFDKYVESNEIKLLSSMFDWYDTDVIYITIAERKEIFDSQNFSYERNSAILSEAFESLKRKFERQDVFNTTSKSTKRVGSKLLLTYPKLSSSCWKTYVDWLIKNDKSSLEISNLTKKLKIETDDMMKDQKIQTYIKQFEEMKEY
jgi:5S rRNA maturation endonuclease (ribonuclease M5)